MGALTLTDKSETVAELEQYLTFMLDGEMFAIGILSVKEIIEYGKLTVVPMMPECIRGVINLRGAVVPVIDLACRFSRRPTRIARRSCIVIIEAQFDGERYDVGIIVDAVSEVLEISPAQIEPPPAFGAHIRAEFIAGMGKVEGGFVIILNVDRVLSLDDLAAVVQAAQGTSEPAALPAQGA